VLVHARSLADQFLGEAERGDVPEGTSSGRHRAALGDPSQRPAPGPDAASASTSPTTTAAPPTVTVPAPTRGQRALVPAAEPNPDILTTKMSTEPFTVFGVTWDHGPGSVIIRYRVRESGRWSDWQATGKSDAVPDSNRSEVASAVFVRSSSILNAAATQPSQPAIISRAGWGGTLRWVYDVTSTAAQHRRARGRRWGQTLAKYSSLAMIDPTMASTRTPDWIWVTQNCWPLGSIPRPSRSW
jgi:hypothetical protein